MSPTNVNLIFYDLAEKAGLGHRVQVKSMRHLFVTELLNGRDGKGGMTKKRAAKLSGHRNEGSLDIYDHVSPIEGIHSEYRSKILGILETDGPLDKSITKGDTLELADHVALRLAPLVAKMITDRSRPVPSLHDQSLGDWLEPDGDRFRKPGDLQIQET